ncbi:hypothetical protein Tco_0173181 [Tanacetum coccineum]
MVEMFGLLKELTANRTSEMVLIREEARHPIAKNVNSISLIQIKEEKNVENNRPINKSVMEPSKSDEEEPPKGFNVKMKLKEIYQGSDVNVMPLSIYNKLTDERPAETDIWLSLASHPYIYPLVSSRMGGKDQASSREGMEFNQWRSKIFNNERLASVKEECELEDEEGVT